MIQRSPAEKARSDALKSSELIHPSLSLFIVRHGLIKSALAFTVVTVLLTVLSTLLIVEIYHHYGIEADRNLMMSIAALASFFVVFPVSLFAVDMFLRLYRIEQRMRWLATYDTLTGLLERRMFFQRAEEVIRDFFREGRPASFLLCDLDDFKKINDCHSHQAGDAVLRRFASILKELGDSRGFCGRLGGEEFALCLVDCTREEATAFSGRLHEVIHKNPVEFNGEVIPFSVSCGLVVLESSMEELSLDSILHNADIALYAAKKNGKDQTVIFEHTSLLPL